MRAFYDISQVESIFSSKVIIIPNNRYKCLEIQLNYLGASDKAIKFSFFPILMRAFRNWPKEFINVASPCFHAVSFVSNLIGNFQFINNLCSWICCSYTLHILFHSETKITPFCLLLFAFIRFHFLYHSLSFVVTRCTTYCHSLYHSLLFVVTRCTTHRHLLSIDVPLFCVFINYLAVCLNASNTLTLL